MTYRAGDERPVLNIEGGLVALGPLRRDLLPLYQRWINDLEAALALGAFLPITVEKETEWYESQAKSESDITFTIYDLSTLRPIGTSGLMRVDHRNRRAEFGILIGEPGCRNRGYGTETARLVLDYAFTVVGLHNVMLRVFEFNRGAVRAYEKAGFKEIGRRRQSYSAGGRVWDEIWMDCLSTEFESSSLGQLFKTDEG
jgi:RimJ/RimL family protein N-acetyltransferase